MNNQSSSPVHQLSLSFDSLSKGEEQGKLYQDKKIKINCKCCGKEFWVIQSRKNTAKYCSRKCKSDDWKKEHRIIKECKNCNKIFYRIISDIKKGKDKFCSHECCHNYRKKHPESHPNWKGGKCKKICLNCGKYFTIQRSKIKTAKYCSRKCMRSYIHKTKTKTFICKKCGKKYEAVQSRKNGTKYCSNKCKNKVITRLVDRSKYKGSGNPNWRGGRMQIEFKCLQCGKIFKSNSRNGNEGRKFCSRKCADNAHKEFMKIFANNTDMIKKVREANAKFWNNPEHRKMMSKKSKARWKQKDYRNKMIKILKEMNSNPELNKKRRIRMKENWQSPKFRKIILKKTKKRPTRLEMLFDEITPKQVRYVGNGAWWRRFRNGHSKNPDFKITGQNKIIELYGDYWHRNDNPQKLIDLYKQVGLECLVIWEHEVYNNQEEVLQKVNEFIST